MHSVTLGLAINNVVQNAIRIF